MTNDWLENCRHQRAINDRMPLHVANLTIHALRDAGAAVVVDGRQVYEADEARRFFWLRRLMNDERRRYCFKN